MKLPFLVLGGESWLRQEESVSFVCNQNMWTVTQQGGEDCSLLVNRFKEVDKDTDLRFQKIMERLGNHRGGERVETQSWVRKAGKSVKNEGWGWHGVWAGDR